LTAKSKAPDFEQALAELESLVGRLERGDLPLDEALKTFARGVELTRHLVAKRHRQQQVSLLGAFARLALDDSLRPTEPGVGAPGLAV